nr:hypothetical protein [Candidatus Njordarchaeota archaeon]
MEKPRKMRKNKSKPRKCLSNQNGAFGEHVVLNCAETLIKRDYIDCVVVIGIGLLEAFTGVLGDKTIVEMGTKRELDEATLLADLKNEHGKPIVGLTIHASENSRVLQYLWEKGGIPVYEDPQTAAQAVRAMLDYKNYLDHVKEAADSSN